MLGLLFVILTARPISMRRLGLFFVLVLALSTGILNVLRARHVLERCSHHRDSLDPPRVEPPTGPNAARQHPGSNPVARWADASLSVRSMDVRDCFGGYAHAGNRSVSQRISSAHGRRARAMLGSGCPFRAHRAGCLQPLGT